MISPTFSELNKSGYYTVLLKSSLYTIKQLAIKEFTQLYLVTNCFSHTNTARAMPVFEKRRPLSTATVSLCSWDFTHIHTKAWYLLYLSVCVCLWVAHP